MVSNLVPPSFPFSSFIDRGEFGEVYQGTAADILGPETGQTPVAVKVCLVHTCTHSRMKSVSLRASPCNQCTPLMYMCMCVCVTHSLAFIFATDAPKRLYY